MGFFFTLRYLLIVDYYRYSDIRQMELELLLEFRNAFEVAAPLKRIVDAVLQGEKPYARAMLHGFMARLAQPEAGGMR
jgi:hypothetical protein